MDELSAQVLRWSLPLVLAALSEVVSERGGVVNLGIEGMMLAGALAAALVTAGGGVERLVPAVGAAVAVGAGLGLLQAVFVVLRRADQIVTGTALGFLCLGATSLVHGRRASAEPGAVFADGGAIWGAAPYVGSLLLVAALSLFLTHTGPGLRLRTAGEDPDALTLVGASVFRSRGLAMILAGGLAGLAGASLTTVLSGQFVSEMTQGRGYLALGLVLFARWSPWGALVAGLFLGAAFTAELQLSLRTAEQSDSALRDVLILATRSLPYILTLGALAVLGPRRWRPPAALGRAQRW